MGRPLTKYVMYADWKSTTIYDVAIHVKGSLAGLVAKGIRRKDGK
jgi:hypothetical protein